MQVNVDHLAYFCCPAWEIDGWQASREISLPMDDIGFRQGVTAVERLRTYNGNLFLLDQHLERLAETLRLVQIDGTPSVEHLKELAIQCIHRNQDWMRNQDCGLTIWMTPGCQPGQPTWAIHLNRIDHALVAHRRKHGQPLVVTQVQQPAPECWSRHAKVRNRLHYYLADQHAKQIAPDATGVLIDCDGSLTETNIANIAIVVDGTLIFAPKEKVLPGVTENHVWTLLSENGVAITRQRIPPEALDKASEVLFFGTDTGVWFSNGVPERSLVYRCGSMCSYVQEVFDRSIPHSK
ncbi:aminotransferase class IV [Rhodopirellula halodulae]|uniref:aminotransferase class IV n=1 Tax=Rhodopirellula halodulae TaxID=2894198 RepID=UPI001E654784|nr:aminotransferase class IV [Rhodopirellula sp. JC737]MCC9658131.1 aminotransferase class IV [Rhodopirellula sp. JC737]